jgi:hypothetical protein
VQIDPGPIPTFIISTPNLIKNLAASGVAIFPAHKAIFLFLNFLINLNYLSNFFSMSMSSIDYY